MIETYFCVRVVARLRANPDFGVLQTFVGYLHHRGFRRMSVQSYVRSVELFLHSLRRRRGELALLTAKDVRRFACRQNTRQKPLANCHAALRHLLRHLREQGTVRPASAFPTHIESIVTGFDDHLRDVAGLAPATRRYHRRHAGEFLRSLFCTKPIRWTEIRPKHVRAFLVDYCRPGHGAAAQQAAVSLRTFFRWLRFTGCQEADLSLAIPSFRRWRHKNLPSALTDNQYVVFLASFDCETVVGRRDYAMAVCMGDLGLRAGEVAQLMVDDLDETAVTLRVAIGKARRGRILPMPSRVQHAILAYLQQGRTTSSDPHLFLRHHTPAGIGVSPAVVREVMRRAFAKVSGCEQLTGTHILRRTAATRLHRAGADFKRIADILGHRQIDTTAIYAKVDLAGLCRVALPWPTIQGERP